MIKFIYEERGITIVYETDQPSLYSGVPDGNDGVLDHFMRFLRAAGYTFEAHETLTTIDYEKEEFVIEQSEWSELQNRVDELQGKQGHGYRVWWSDADRAWIAQHPDHPHLQGLCTTDPAVALSKLRDLERQEKTDADSPITDCDLKKPERRDDGWIPWHGGKCPVDPKAKVQVQFQNDDFSSSSHRAGEWNWSHTGGAHDIIAYRVVEEDEGTKKTGPLSQNGWIPWHGGECPVDNGVRVDARLRNGEMQNDTPAGGWNWAHIDDDFDIIAYRVIEGDA